MPPNLNQIVKLASDQFQVPNAEERISPVSELSDVFAPPHHGPRNVPIEVAKVDHGDNFTHFPIVNSGVYYLFLPHEAEDVEVFDMHYNGPSQHDPHYYPIELEEIPSKALSGSPFKQGFKSKTTIIFNQSDPQPIAIHFSVRSDEDDFVLKYIVVKDNTN
ncbi:hypothetical protein [Tenacibaculum agarivorans]|uniref:hypothetical protein n=1 Tax=Tenacibaculum agarivorans TaxID=1908389 RepID=UPI00094B80CE|nr:hypothetical protein [Tenacibaculum agarivorans]